MSLKSLIIAGAAVAALAAPAAAFADPHWGGGRDGYHEGYRGGDRDGWRGHEWRDHGGWGRRDYGWGYGWGRGGGCWVEERGHYDGYGEYVYSPVRVCR